MDITNRNVNVTTNYCWNLFLQAFQSAQEALHLRGFTNDTDPDQGECKEFPQVW